MNQRVHYILALPLKYGDTSHSSKWKVLFAKSSGVVLASMFDVLGCNEELRWYYHYLAAVQSDQKPTPGEMITSGIGRGKGSKFHFTLAWSCFPFNTINNNTVNHQFHGYYIDVWTLITENLLFRSL